MKPDVSVIVTVYKRLQFMDALMEGIFNQTLSNWELIFVDDGSDMPELTEICQRYAQQDKRIKYIYQQNGGVSSARNRGIAEASAEFISFHDDDDVSCPQWLEKEVDFLRQHPQIAVVGCYGIRIDEAGKIVARDSSHLLSAQPLIYEINPPLAPVRHIINNCCCRRDCLAEVGGFDIDFRVGEDIELILRLEEKYSLAILREELHNYRGHTSSRLSANPHIWKYIVLAYIAAYFRRNNLTNPSDDRALLSYAKVLPESILSGIFKVARGGHKRLMRSRKYKELAELLDDFNVAFSFSPKYRIKMYRSLIAWSLYYGRLGALPMVIKKMIKL